MRFLWLGGTDPSPSARFDLDRAKIRLDGFVHYASVAALLLNAALRLESSTPTKLDNRKHENFVKMVFLCLISACVVLATYTTTVFSLYSLYAKSFLGMSMDEEYMAFFQLTAEIRKSAFVAFIATVLSFNAALVLWLYLSNEGRARFWLASITAVVIAIGAQNWFLLIQYAQHMYNNV